MSELINLVYIKFCSLPFIQFALLYTYQYLETIYIGELVSLIYIKFCKTMNNN